MTHTSSPVAGSTQDFTNVAVNGWIGFWGEGSITVDHAWALCKGGNLLKILDTKKDITINQGYFSSANANLSFGANLDNGIYEPTPDVPLSRRDRMEKMWVI